MPQCLTIDDMTRKGTFAAIAAFVGFVVVSALAALFILRHTQRHELDCFVIDPAEAEFTDIYSEPDGEVVFRIETGDFYQFTAIAGPDGWWRIKNSRLYSFGEEIEIPSREAWIRQSELALGTDNGDGQYRPLRTEPRADAPKAGTITEFNAVVRPLELSENGLWVKVCYEPEGLTGWLEVSKVRDEAFEPGDGYDFPCLNVYAVPDKDFAMLSSPGKGEKTFLLEKGKTYMMNVAKAKGDWWQLIGGYVTCDDEDVQVLDESWVPASALCLRVSEDAVPLHVRTDEKSRVVGNLEAGAVVHPLEVAGTWPVWVRVVSDGNPALTGWTDSSSLSWSPED